MSLSSTGNSLKSSGTFNSNSSINSTPSVDRYAALKDLDEQLREMKEVNTQTAPNPANPFNSGQTAPVGNPFQATQIPSSIAVPTQNGWHNEQQQFNGTSPNMFGSPHGFGMNGVATGPHMNGNGLQQSQQQHYQKMPSQNMFNGSIGMSNGYPQKNPFAVSNEYIFSNGLNYSVFCFLSFFFIDSSIKCDHKSIFINSCSIEWKLIAIENSSRKPMENLNRFPHPHPNSEHFSLLSKCCPITRMRYAKN